MKIENEMRENDRGIDEVGEHGDAADEVKSPPVNAPANGHWRNVAVAFSF